MVSQDFPPAAGGIQTYAFELAQRLAPRCNAFHLVCPESGEAAPVDAQLPFPVHRARASSDTLPILAAPLIARLVLQQRVDALFHLQWQTAPIGALLRRTGRVKTLAIAAHGKELLLRPLIRMPRAQRIYDRVRANVLEAADLVLPVSRFTAELLRTRASARARQLVVPNGVDVNRVAGGDRRAFRRRHGLERARVLLTVARLVPRKGIDSVIASMPALLAQVPNAEYLIVGEGPDESRLRALAEQHGVSARVRFFGRLEAGALRDCYAACDAFVLAARDEADSVEGFGLVLLEASACGRATVATTAGGMGDAVEHGVTGLLVPPGDARALSSALSAVLSDPELAKRLGDAGRRHARAEGSWDRAAECIYDALVSCSRRP